MECVIAPTRRGVTASVIMATLACLVNMDVDIRSSSLTLAGLLQTEVVLSIIFLMMIVNGLWSQN
jgi:hypothetical protein